MSIEKKARNSLFEAGPAIGHDASVLLYHLYGAMDAGSAGNLAVEQILASSQVTRVATFNTDELVDYRSHRPVITFEEWSIVDLEMPQIVLDLVEDVDGKSFLLLHGPEPDNRWELFAKAVSELAEKAEVQTTLGLMGVPAAVPHTRATPVHVHASKADLVPKQAEVGTIHVSASIGMFLQARLGESGYDSLGLVSAVPYYLSDGGFPQASAALLTRAGTLTGLVLPVGDLEAAATLTRNQVDSQVEEISEIRQVVNMMEKQFDAEDMSKVSTSQVIPSADEIAARIETFLGQEDARSRAIPDAAALPMPFDSNNPDKETDKEPAWERPPGKPRGRHRGVASWDESPTE